MIANASLNATQIDYLLRVLRKHRKAKRCTFDNLKGIHHSLCIHRNLMEDDHKPSIEHQRRLNPSMQEVVKKGNFKIA